MTNWRGRETDPCRREPQVANAEQDFPNLTPASQTRATQTRANWAAQLRGQTIPLIGEDCGYNEELDSDGCPY